METAMGTLLANTFTSLDFLGLVTEAFGNQPRVSNDHGRIWSEALTNFDNGVGGDLVYPSTVQLADGSLLPVWYEGGSYQNLTTGPHEVLRQSHWTLSSKQGDSKKQ